MASQWTRRARWAAGCAVGLLLAACGSGTIESQLSPTRLVAFGDGFADLGQNGARFTVNGTGTVDNWTQYVATAFGRTLATSKAGGLSYATGNARVAVKPDAGGSAATPTVKEQVDTYLATGKFDANDLVLVNAGTSDVIVEANAALAGAQTREQMLANVGKAGVALGEQVLRLVAAGARHVVVVGPYNLVRSPWGQTNSQVAPLLDAGSSRFSEQVKVTLEKQGDTVLFIDAAFYFNLVSSSPGSYSLTNARDILCTSADPGPGIGTGTGQINANLCTTGTILAGANHENYLFADRVYVTPHGQRLFGEYAYDRIRERW